MVAGPVFLEIARKVFATSINIHPLISKSDSLDVPFTKTGNRKELRNVIRDLDIPVDNDHIKSDWVNTERKDNAVVFSRHSVIEGLVPNVVSMGAKDAVFLLENAGLKVRLLGRGSVRSQSISPGSRLVKGEQIVLEMSRI
jgi:cell division protein FtsI (penicillin-binding protein 3)